MRTELTPPSQTKPTIRRLLLDPWVATVLALTVVFIVIPHVQWLDEGFKSFVSLILSTIVLLALAVGAVFFAAARLQSARRERLFWRLIGVAIAAWLAGEVVSALFYWGGEDPTAGVGVDALYLVFYLLFVLALDLEPQLAERSLKNRRLRLLGGAGRTLFACGLFVYFVLLPRTVGLDEYLSWIPSFSLYVVLDLYLIARLLHITWETRRSHWRVVFAMLTGAATMMLVTDSLDLAWIASLMPATLPPGMADLLWYAPMILFTLAGRLRIAVGGEEDLFSSGDGDRLRSVPLLVYSLGFTLIHLAYSLVQQDTEASREARIVLVMLSLVLFGILNLLQNSIIQREVDQQSRLRKKAEEHVRALSLRDSLTGLLNRRALEAELARAVARADRTGLTLGLMFVDLDRFKVVNDTLGHSAGDAVLREAAARLETCLREVDTLARFGGDEFVLVLEALESRSDAEAIGRRILTSFAMALNLEGAEVELSASIGIAIQPLSGRTPAQLLAAADRAMYKVKQSGGAGVEFAPDASARAQHEPPE